MPRRLSRSELKIMDVLWSRGSSSVREVHDSLPERGRPGYTTVQTLMYRLEAKNAVRRVGKAGNAHIFEAVVARNTAHRRLVDELLSVFGGRAQPLMSHLIESGNLTLEDVHAAEAQIKASRAARKPK